MVRRQVVGIYDGALLETYARVLLRLGAERILVVRGEDGMDEFSLSAPTRVCHVDADRGIWQETVEPEENRHGSIQLYGFICFVLKLDWLPRRRVFRDAAFQFLFDPPDEVLAVRREVPHSP